MGVSSVVHMTAATRTARASSLLAIVLACAIVLLPQRVLAQVGIRDAEIEETLALYSDPIFSAAGLPNIEINIINDPAINAFVAGGQQIFVFTGTILESETPNHLIGILAHETGHITGGHLSQRRSAAEQASVPVLLSTLLGIGAAVAGAGEAGAAIIAGGQQVGTRNFLSYTRTQESSADQAAASLLDATGQSISGLIEMLQKVADQNVLSRKLADSYALTHPLSRERIALLRAHAQTSPFTSRTDPADWQMRHERMQAKIMGFLAAPRAVFNKYPESDNGLSARYARSVAYHRLAQRDRAIAEIDSLLAEYPDDPYFRELKGQILFEGGRVREAIAEYELAVAAAPNQPLIRLALGQALVASEDPSLIEAAIPHLEAGVGLVPDFVPAWYSLATAYDRIGERGRAELATAERLSRTGKVPEARDMAKRAMDKLPAGSPSWLRASDIANM